MTEKQTKQDMVNINFDLSKELHVKFKSKTALGGVHMKEKLREMIRNYVKDFKTE